MFMLPITWLKHLAQSRAKLRETVMNYVAAAMEAAKDHKNLLTLLILANHPETGAKLTQPEITCEALDSCKYIEPSL